MSNGDKCPRGTLVELIQVRGTLVRGTNVQRETCPGDYEYTESYI